MKQKGEWRGMNSELQLDNSNMLSRETYKLSAKIYIPEGTNSRLQHTLFSDMCNIFCDVMLHPAV
jgi:hypothetical protein